MIRNSDDSDPNTIPFDHAQTTMMLHSTALARMARDKALSYEEALDWATSKLRAAAIRARVLMERAHFDEAEVLVHHQSLDVILGNVKSEARRLTGASSDA